MSKKKYLLSILLFLFLTFGTYYFVFKDYSFSLFLSSLSYCNPLFIVISFVSMFFWAFFEALYLKVMCFYMGYKISYYKAFGYVFTECYFSAITPSSIGGQPVQMAEMSHDGIPYRVSSVIILLNTLIYKIALIIIATIGIILFKDILFSFNTLFNWLVLLGFITTILLIICFLVLVYSKKLMYYIVKLVICVLNKLHIFKSIKEKENKLNASLKDYQECALLTKKKPSILIISLIILLCQRLSILAVSYFIYKSFGLNDNSIYFIIAMQSCITLGSDFMPFPGGVVVAEGLLFEANKIIYGSNLATPAMILLRTISFYSIVIFSLLFYIYFHFKKRNKSEVIGGCQ